MSVFLVYQRNMELPGSRSGNGANPMLIVLAEDLVKLVGALGAFGPHP